MLFVQLKKSILRNRLNEKLAIIEDKDSENNQDDRIDLLIGNNIDEKLEDFISILKDFDSDIFRRKRKYENELKSYVIINKKRNIQIILGNDGRLLTILPIKNKHFEVDESNKEVTDELKSIKKKIDKL